MNSTFDIQRVCVDGISVAYSKIGGGDKNSIVLQGWGTNFKMYETIARAIEDEYTTYLFDLPGFGLTKEPSTPFDVRDYAQFFLHFIELLGIKSVTLIGHSYGGRIIIELLGKKLNDFDVEHVVLIDSAGIMPDRTTFQKFKTKIYRIKKKILLSRVIFPLFPEVITDWKNRQGSADYRNASECMKVSLIKAVNYDQRYLLPKIDNDTLLIWGTEDDATPINDALIMEQGIKKAGLVKIEGAGHYSFLDNPALVRQVLRTFLINKSNESMQ